jgi:nucleoside-diphosphate-sugar epimerase
MGVTTNLVLGGEGTIGSALCQFLERLGEHAISLDKKSGYDICEGNLDHYKNVDYVWFLAWDVGGSKYLSNKKNNLQIIRNNTILCEKVFTFLNKNKLKFLFASSQLATTDTPYGITKLLGEEWSRILGGQVVRFWNVYGWEEPGERSHVIPDLILQGLSKNKIELYTDGKEERQFIYIDDCVANMIKVRDTNTSVADITDGNWITISRLADKIGHLLDVPVLSGEASGYSNKLEPKYILEKFKFNTTLEEGIKLVITHAKEYLKERGSALL